MMEQLAVPLSVQLVGLSDPPAAVHVMLPVGVVGAEPPSDVTEAVQVVGASTSSGLGTHETMVAVLAIAIRSIDELVLEWVPSPP